ncbi:MAG: AAA family ATPase [Prevotella sp.]|uniref:AAA family ATPase n=1 Tax=Prevotella sp. AGR2160 TaxID=1280674 RepID=UPI00040B9988|nr:AAA family ATPase [Prevotella sp. AGR2160]MDD5860956.1 AAA family ATPase [Prevotella sp.]
MSKITKIVLTGGPCAGKTTALVKINDHFSGLGYKVFTIPEVPTIFQAAGMDYLTSNKDFFFQGELSTLKIQLAFEDQFLKMAETLSEPVLIIYDRGVMDISAYMKPEMWQQIISQLGYTTQQLRDERYDAVLHLVSAADGAEQYYTVANNKERTEGIEKARLVDKRVIAAWTGHPHLRVINNHDNFDNKIFRVIQEISSVLGLPQPIVEEHRYVVELTGEVPEATTTEISQIYLVTSPGTQIRLRKRVSNGKEVIIHTTRKVTPNHEMIETERQINNNLYESMLRQADPYRHPVEKTRRSFIWKGQYFELDDYHSPIDHLMILETKGVTEHESVNFPPFIRVVKDITGNAAYDNYNLALGKIE